MRISFAFFKRCNEFLRHAILSAGMKRASSLRRDFGAVPRAGKWNDTTRQDISTEHSCLLLGYRANYHPYYNHKNK